MSLHTKQTKGLIVYLLNLQSYKYLLQKNFYSEDTFSISSTVTDVQKKEMQETTYSIIVQKKEMQEITYSTIVLYLETM